jgi:hypothetical protein
VRNCEHVLRVADDHGVHAPGTDDKGADPATAADDKGVHAPNHP